jgi:hypothetical protein
MKKPVLSLFGFSAGTLLLGGLGVGLQGWGLSVRGSAVLLAEEPDPLADTDHDLLPDLLERVQRTNPLSPDTDCDRASDFVETVSFTNPRVADAARPLDTFFRVLCYSTRELIGGTPSTVLYINHLLVIPSGRAQDLQDMAFFLDIGGTRIDSTNVMVQFSRNVATIQDPNLGLLARITTRIPFDPLLRVILPATFGAYVRVMNRVLGAGGLLAVRGNALTILLPDGSPSNESATFSFAPLDDSETTNNPFWSQNRLCILELSVEGIRQGGQICEVRNADCQPSEDERCSTDCRTSVGNLIFLPDGLSIIRGG